MFECFSLGASSDFVRSTGGIMPVNMEPLLPLPARNEFVLSHVVFTQFLSEQFGFALGKLDPTGGDMNEFAHGRGDTQFMNLALQFNPVPIRAAPYSTLGIRQRFRQKFLDYTLQKGGYAIIFNQKGLMGGIGIQGSKITKITPDK